MKKNIITAMVLLSLLLSSCDTNGGNVNLEVNETAAEITEVTEETIHLNNCGGKADTEQNVERSKMIHIEVGGTLGVNAQAVKGEVSAKYGDVTGYSKNQKLTAPPDTNMEFILRWTEKTWVGVITAQGKDGQENYKVSVPIAVELIFTQDLGCNPEAGDLTDSSNSPVEISAYCAQFDNSPSYVKTGQEVILTWGWSAKTNAYRQDYIDSVTFSVQLDGQELDTSPASITLTTNDLEEYNAGWRLPPIILSEGTHQVMITQIFSRQITDGFDSDNDGSIDIFEPSMQSVPPCEIIVE